MLERFWGAGVADPEEKRLRNAWEAPGLRVTFAAGLAVSLGATGAGRAFPAPAPAALEPQGCRWEMGVPV